MSTLDIRDKSNYNPKAIESTSVTFDPFKDEVAPDALLSIIDGFIQKLEAISDTATSARILNQLADYEIITVHHNGQNHWLKTPVSLHAETFKSSINDRVIQWIKSRGQESDATVTRERIGVRSFALPIDVPIPASSMQFVELDSGVTVLMALKSLHKLLSGAFQCDKTHGVFPKPYGAENTDWLVSQITKYNRYGEWAVKETLQTKTLADVVRNAAFIAND